LFIKIPERFNCMLHSLTFDFNMHLKYLKYLKLIDMKWGITEEIPMNVCLEELEKCYKLSVGPSVVVSFTFFNRAVTVKYYICILRPF
jgi:hypothetical protein